MRRNCRTRPGDTIENRYRRTGAGVDRIKLGRFGEREYMTVVNGDATKRLEFQLGDEADIERVGGENRRRYNDNRYKSDNSIIC